MFSKWFCCLKESLHNIICVLLCFSASLIHNIYLEMLVYIQCIYATFEMLKYIFLVSGNVNAIHFFLPIGLQGMASKICISVFNLSPFVIHKHTLSELCFDLLTTSDVHTQPHYSIYNLHTQRKHIPPVSCRHGEFQDALKKQQKQLIHPQTLLVKMLKSEHSHYT